MSQDCLRTGDKAVVRCRFIKLPEYLRIGQRIVLREGRTKAVGNIINVFPDAPGPGTESYSHPPQRSGNPPPKPSGNAGRGRGGRGRGISRSIIPERVESVG